MLIQTWYTKIDQWNGIDIPEIKPHMYGNDIYDRVGIANLLGKKKKDVLIIDLERYGGKCTWILSSHYKQNLIHLN